MLKHLHKTEHLGRHFVLLKVKKYGREGENQGVACSAFLHHVPRTVVSKPFVSIMQEGQKAASVASEGIQTHPMYLSHPHRKLIGHQNHPSLLCSSKRLF